MRDWLMIDINCLSKETSLFFNVSGVASDTVVRSFSISVSGLLMPLKRCYDVTGSLNTLEFSNI